MVKKSTKIVSLVLAAILIAVVVAFFLLNPQTQQPKPPVVTNKLIALAVFNNSVTILNATTMEKINYTSAPFPLVSSYVLASDEHFLYIGFIDLNAETPANIWRINSTGSHLKLALPGYTNIHKLWVQSDLFALVSNDRTNAITILDINASFAISKSVVLLGIAGRPTDLAVASDGRYMTAFNVSTDAGYLAKIDSSLNVTDIVNVPANSPAKICVSGDNLFLRCSDSVLKYSTDLTFISQTPGIFGYGGLAVVGDKLAVAGYKINVGSPCVYWLNPDTFAIANVTDLSASAGSAFQVTAYGNSTLVSIWEAQVGSSVVKIASDGHITKLLVSDRVNAWPVDLRYFESEP